MAGRDQYDITPRNREILEFRASRRNALRQEFLKETLNPHRHASGIGGAVFDQQLQRLFSLDATRAQYVTAKGKNFAQFAALTLFPIVSIILVINKVRRDKETEIRTGKISYRDRHVKFV
ncbi:uncharacterized protein LOC107266414 [Cephus cinctus]|uniref:NADH dehydrogenase [ubiquinone] 1 beta subcomplex subunit 4 n=1 Tax=Cephus cinctus TaxID=211228 RepID=A0AAJ7BR38_CEPCN|nr:uncharacterized protein LOC107266414 [Cephus cinctus]